MTEPFENITNPPAYRFIDPADNQIDRPNSSLPISVEFHPDIDDFVYIAQVNRKAYKLQFRARYAVQIFLLVNMIGLPATLWFFGWFLAGIIVFVTNVSIAGLFIPTILKSDYRRFFESLFGNIENEIVKIELGQEGLSSAHLGDTSFHRWRNVKRIEETKESIFFFLANGRAIAVRKSGFAYDNEKNRFLNFARGQIKALTPHDRADRS